MDIVRKILVPIDFSGDFANGLNYAVSIAQKTQAEVVALHVAQKDGAYEFLGFLRGAGGRPDAVSAAELLLWIDCCRRKRWTFIIS
jgi:Universal stress protein family